MPTFLNAKKPEDLKPGQGEVVEANGLVYGDRQGDYGTPKENYTALAKAWSGILHRKLKADLTAEEVALCFVGAKIVRETFKHKRDNIVDAHGYLIVHGRIREESE